MTQEGSAAGEKKFTKAYSPLRRYFVPQDDKALLDVVLPEYAGEPQHSNTAEFAEEVEHLFK